MTTFKLFGKIMGTNKTEEELAMMNLAVAEPNNRIKEDEHQQIELAAAEPSNHIKEEERAEEIQRPKRRKSKIKKIRSSSPPTPPAPLPDPMMQAIQEMEGKDLAFMTRKILEWSDTATAENRFFVPKNEVLWMVLAEEERRAVEGGVAVEVTVVDPRGGRYDMKLRKWMSLNKVVLNSGWRKFVDGCKLKEEIDCVEIWSFRSYSKLCFAFNVKRELPDINL